MCSHCVASSCPVHLTLLSDSRAWTARTAVPQARSTSPLCTGCPTTSWTSATVPDDQRTGVWQRFGVAVLQVASAAPVFPVLQWCGAAAFQAVPLVLQVFFHLASLCLAEAHRLYNNVWTTTPWNAAAARFRLPAAARLWHAASAPPRASSASSPPRASPAPAPPRASSASATLVTWTASSPHLSMRFVLFSQFQLHFQLSFIFSFFILPSVTD